MAVPLLYAELAEGANDHGTDLVVLVDDNPTPPKWAHPVDGP
jgi:hypothetical protein